MGQMELLLNVYASQKVLAASTCVLYIGLKVLHAGTRTTCAPCGRADICSALAMCVPAGFEYMQANG